MDENDGLETLDNTWIHIRCPDPRCLSTLFTFQIHTEREEIAFLCANCRKGGTVKDVKEFIAEGKIIQTEDQGNPDWN